MPSFLEIILVGANKMDDMGLRTRKEQRWGGWVSDSSPKELINKDCIGERFPSWMMNEGFGSLLQNLAKIMTKSCKRFRVLPVLFGQLPSLQYLELEYLDSVWRTWRATHHQQHHSSHSWRHFDLKGCLI